MKQIDREQWERAKRQGYTLIKDGVKYMLMLENGGTVLAPVEIIENNPKGDKQK